MKKLLILSAILVSGTLAANAQDGTPKTANIGVNVADVRTIEITAGGTVNFALNTTEDYTKAATSTGLGANVKTSFNVVSRGGYKVKAGLKGDLTTAATGNGSKTIPGTAIGINVDAAPVVSSGENAATANNNLRKFAAGSTAAAPSEIEELVITDADAGGTRGTTFDVKYTMLEFPAVVNLAVGNFQSTVVYTIEGL